ISSRAAPFRTRRKNSPRSPENSTLTDDAGKGGGGTCGTKLISFTTHPPGERSALAVRFQHSRPFSAVIFANAVIEGPLAIMSLLVEFGIRHSHFRTRGQVHGERRIHSHQ